MAARGFSPEMGVTQKALEELRERQAEELAELETKKGLEELETKAKFGEFLAKLPSEVVRYISAAKPEIFTLGGTAYAYSPLTGKLTPLATTPEEEEEGTPKLVKTETGEYVWVYPSGKTVPTGLKGTLPASKGAGYVTAAMGVINQIENLLDRLNLGKTPTEALKRGAELEASAWAKTNPDASAYKSLVEGTLSILLRALGEVGALSNIDIARARKLIPTFFDTEEVAKAKIEQLKDLIKNAAKARGVVTPEDIDELNEENFDEFEVIEGATEEE